MLLRLIEVEEGNRPRHVGNVTSDIPESMVVPEGSSPESGLGWLLRSHWRQVASCNLLLYQNLTKRRVVIGRIDG